MPIWWGRRDDRDRSRSRGGDQSEWISRQVAFLARYPEKRPPGLTVDSSGTMRLSNLAGAWGNQHNLEKQEILDAIERHKFHERSNTVRFHIDELSNGDFTICVFKRRDGVKAGEKDPARAPRGARAPRRQPRGSVGSCMGEGAEEQGGPDASKAKADDRGGKSEDDDEWSRRRPRGWGGQKNDDGSWNRGRGSWSGPGWRDEESKKQDRPAWEQAQRWLAYALRRGSEDLGLVVHAGGWASVDDLAEAMAYQRPDFGVKDGDQLRKLLRDTDAQGRFELDDKGRMRKLAREDRAPRAWAGTGDAWREPAAAGTAYADADAAASKGDKKSNGGPPDNPPGQNWTKYSDDGVIWWFYDGPKGKWWKQESDARPQPWTDD